MSTTWRAPVTRASPPRSSTAPMNSGLTGPRPPRRTRSGTLSLLTCMRWPTSCIEETAKPVVSNSGTYCRVGLSLSSLHQQHGEKNMTTPVAPGTRIGHVHLKVADLDRAIEFYSGVLGFELQQKYGSQAAFV